MIVRNEDFVVTDIVGVQYTTNVNGEKRYGVNLHIRGGGYISFRTGSCKGSHSIISVLSDIILDEHINNAHNKDANHEYIVTLSDDCSKVLSKQLLTEDKAETILYFKK